MSVAWLIAGIVVGVWLLVALLQLGDVATVFLDSRTARDRDIPGRIARERTNELFWLIPVAALVALGIGLGIDVAARALFTENNIALGVLFLLGLAVLVVALAVLNLAAVTATDPISYSALRREMREHEGERLTPAQLADYRARLARIDSRARSRVRLTPLFLTAPTIFRVVSVFFGLLVIAAVWTAVIVDPTNNSASLGYVAILAPLINALLGALAIGFSITSDAAWRRVYARQRVDILKLLEGFERSTRKGVAGLGERVARALKILGEQQQPGS